VPALPAFEEGLYICVWVCVCESVSRRANKCVCDYVCICICTCDCLDHAELFMWQSRLCRAILQLFELEMENCRGGYEQTLSHTQTQTHPDKTYIYSHTPSFFPYAYMYITNAYRASEAYHSHRHPSCRPRHRNPSLSTDLLFRLSL